MGVATGDRDPEFPAFGVAREERGRRFREAVACLRAVWCEEFPEVDGPWGALDGDLDLVPKPTTETVPLLPTGRSRQSMDWLGDHGDGWLFYHLPEDTLESFLADWREVAGEKPYAMAVRTVLADDPAADPEPVHQGYRAGSEWFLEYLRDLDTMGVDHVLVGVSEAGDDGDPERALTRFAERVLEEL
jgi:luciferase-type oxidoreductase